MLADVTKGVRDLLVSVTKGRSYPEATNIRGCSQKWRYIYYLQNLNHSCIYEQPAYVNDHAVRNILRMPSLLGLFKETVVCVVYACSQETYATSVPL